MVNHAVILFDVFVDLLTSPGCMILVTPAVTVFLMLALD